MKSLLREDDFLQEICWSWAPAEPPSKAQPWAVKSLIDGEQMVARQKQFCGGIWVQKAY